MNKLELTKLIREEIRKTLNEETQLMSDPATKSKVEMVIKTLKDIDIDGETMEYILHQVGMSDQMSSQLRIKEGTDLLATSDRDIQLIIKYLNSIGIKPVYPRYFTGPFSEKRELDIDMDRDNKPFTKEYAALENDQAKFRQVLQKANVPNKPVLVCMYQDKFGSYALGIYNTNLKKNIAALSKVTTDFEYFVIK